MCGFVENINIGVYSGNINLINVKLCMTVQLTEFHLFIPLSVASTVFRGHSNVEDFN